MNYLKYICFAFFVSCTTPFLQAQSTVFVSADSSTSVDVYAGLLASTSGYVDSFHVTTGIGVRAGVAFSYEPLRWFAVRGFSVGNYHTDGSAYAINSILAEFHDAQGKMFARVGMIPQASTWLHRPYPMKGWSQFEPYSRRIIPGGAPGVLLKYQIRENLGLYGSVAHNQGSLEMHLGANFRDIVKVSGWYAGDEQWGTAVSVNAGPISSTLTMNQEVIANITGVTLGGVWIVYSDLGLNYADKQLVRAEFGFLRLFGGPMFNGLFGLGYAQESKTVNGYLMFTL